MKADEADRACAKSARLLGSDLSGGARQAFDVQGEIQAIIACWKDASGQAILGRVEDEVVGTRALRVWRASFDGIVTRV